MFGLLASVFVAFTGDEHAFITVRTQPMKLAAMESLYVGHKPSGLIAVGVANPDKKPGDDQDPFLVKLEIPGMLSLLAHREFGGFVAGIDDLLWGNAKEGIVGIDHKMERGRAALASLIRYKQAKKDGDSAAAAVALTAFRVNQAYLGYGQLQSPEQAVPPVPLIFYAFRLMVGLGLCFILLFLLFLWHLGKGALENKRWLLKLGVAGVAAGYVAQQCGWIVSEVGRQPWAIQGLLPVTVARSNLDSGTVATTFFLFLALFIVLFGAWIRIMRKQIVLGPQEVE